MLRLFEGLFFILVATVIVWQWIIPALRDEPLFPWFRYRHLHRERARAQHDSTLRAHGLHGVSTEIQERLDDEIPVKTQPREARIVVALDLHGAGRFGR